MIATIVSKIEPQEIKGENIEFVLENFFTKGQIFKEVVEVSEDINVLFNIIFIAEIEGVKIWTLVLTYKDSNGNEVHSPGYLLSSRAQDREFLEKVKNSDSITVAITNFIFKQNMETKDIEPEQVGGANFFNFVIAKEIKDRITDIPENITFSSREEEDTFFVENKIPKLDDLFIMFNAKEEENEEESVKEENE